MNKALKNRPMALFHNSPRSKIIKGFVSNVLKITRELTFKKRYVDYAKFIEGVIDFSSIVFDENDRLIFQPGEVAIMKAVFGTAKREMPQRMVLLIGTEYGLAVMHGRVESYHAMGEDIDGEMPTLHATMQLRAAAQRHLARTDFNPSHSIYANDADVMEWLMSDNFRETCAKQAELDRASGIEVGDGMKVFEKKPYIPREQTAKKPHQHRNKPRKPAAEVTQQSA